jgi:hypothetical protein
MLEITPKDLVCSLQTTTHVTLSIQHNTGMKTESQPLRHADDQRIHNVLAHRSHSFDEIHPLALNGTLLVLRIRLF